MLIFFFFLKIFFMATSMDLESVLDRNLVWSIVHFVVVCYCTERTWMPLRTEEGWLSYRGEQEEYLNLGRGILFHEKRATNCAAEKWEWLLWRWSRLKTRGLYFLWCFRNFDVSGTHATRYQRIGEIKRVCEKLFNLT